MDRLNINYRIMGKTVFLYSSYINLTDEEKQRCERVLQSSQEPVLSKTSIYSIIFNNTYFDIYAGKIYIPSYNNECGNLWTSQFESLEKVFGFARCIEEALAEVNHPNWQFTYPYKKLIV